MSSDGYIYVKDWDRFQHYGNRRPVWIKVYLDLLENEDYLELGAAARALLEGIWKWTAVVGNGRVPAEPASLRRRLRLRNCHLEPLIHAGFIEVQASKALAPCYQPAITEKEEREGLQPSLSQKENARASRAAETAARARPDETHRRSFAALGPPTKNGDQPDAADIGRRRRVVKNNYDGVLLENGPESALEWLQENHPDLVKSIISQKPATKETSA